MRKDKEKAIRLRRQNKSYREINQILGVPKSTLATWFKSDELSQKTKNLLAEIAKKASTERIKKMNAVSKIKWERWREAARQDAKKQFAELSKNPLFIAGLMLYWGEGDSKPKNPLRFTNTDPRMLALYVSFLTRILRLQNEKLRATMILYSDLSENECLTFWSKNIKIPKSQFYKTQFIKGRHPTARLSNGICMITHGGRQLKEKVIVWIDLLSKTL